jgi:flavin-dependent dehydrogenase
VERRADVIVIGLGSAGAAASTFFAQKGFRVVAVDKRPVGETGARWVNSVPRWCFEDARVATPSGEELFGGHAPDAEHVFHLIAPGGAARLPLKAPPVLHVDMRRFVDRLVREAISAGVEVLRGSLREVVLEQARVVGVRVETDAGERRIDARLIVDASGIGGAVRRRVPSLAAAWPEVDEESRCIAAEFQYAVSDKAALEAFLKSHGALPGHDLAFPGCAGGYSTLTLFTTKSLDTVGLLTGSIPATGVMDAGALLDAFVATAPWLGERLFGGRGAIPVTRPYDMLASSGVALIGDAACQVHAAHGSGVGMGLLAARVLADAVQEDPGSEASLRAYTRNFHRAHGGLLATADAFRRFIQQASRDDLVTLLTAGLLDEKLAHDGLAQRITRPDVAMVFAMAPRAARVPGLALRFLPLAAKSGVLDLVGGSTRMRGLVNALVGSAPGQAGAGEWSVPSGTPKGAR